MNRICSLVWNHALGALQVASELARAKGGGSGTSSASPWRKHPLALACVVALAMTTFMSPAKASDGTAFGGGGATAGSGLGTPILAAGAGGSAGISGPTAGSGNQPGAAGSTPGGNGGDAAQVSNQSVGAGGGGGGANGGNAFSSSTLKGGNGGMGGWNGYSGGGGGGGGGIGVVLSGASGSLNSSGIIEGGSGGGGGVTSGYAPSGGGGGGGGGDGLYISTSTAGTSVALNAAVLGGAGGTGGASGGGGGNNSSGTGGSSNGNGGAGIANTSGGGGGGGGSGVSFYSTAIGSTLLSNTSTIAGGAGGNGGLEGGNNGDAGNGGSGGAGVSLSANQMTFTNTGSIAGGGGGAAGVCGPNCTGNAGMAGGGGFGVVVSGGNNTIINAGSISGGLNGDGTTRANAVYLSGGGNTLILENGYSFTGNVVASSDTLVLGGSSGATFDASLIGTQFQGFATYGKTGTSTWTLTRTTSAVTPWSIDGGTLSVSSDGSLGNASGTLAFNGGTLENTAAFATARNVTLNAGGGTFQTDADLTESGAIGGSGGLTKTGTGTLTLTGANPFSGGTTIEAGTLQIGNGSTSGSISGNVTDNGSLVFDRSDAVTFAGAISGSGALQQIGGGALTLDGNNGAFAGNTTVQSGSLVVGSVAGNGAVLGGNVTVDDGATLGGHGTIGGNVEVSSGGVVAPGDSIGTLTVNGNLTAAQGSVLNYEFGAPAPGMFTAFGQGDSIDIGGNLELDGATLNVSDAGGMGPGLYNVFTYSGTLSESNGGITLGNTAGQMLQVQNLTAQKQINLIDLTGYPVDFWNANGQASSTQMGGGSGTWSTTSPEWTDATGIVPNRPMSPQPGFAIFGGAPGTVAVDNSAGQVNATGLQFAVNGYTLSGGTLTLVDDASGNAPVIRVGDGSSAGAGMTATINNALAGTDGFIKTDAGTLVLAGANVFTGGTTIKAGAVAVGTDTALGAGKVDMAAGTTLSFAATGLSLANAFALNGDPAFDVASGQTDTVSGVIADGATPGTLEKIGAGTLILAGANTYGGGTTINAGTLQVGNGSTAGSIVGNVTDNGTLAFDRSDAVTYAGTISGNGALMQAGSGMLTLNGASGAFSGSTAVKSGALVVGDAAHANATLGGTVTVAPGATIGGAGTIGGVDLAGAFSQQTALGNIGTLHVNGNATFEHGSIFDVQAISGGEADLLAATGSVTIKGGNTLVIVQGSNWAPRIDYTIITAAGGVSGTFSGVSDNLAFLDPVLSYQSDAVEMSLERNDINFQDVAQTMNQRDAAIGANGLGWNSALHNQLVKLDAPTARSAFDQLSGEYHASQETARLDDPRYVREAMNQRLQGQLDSEAAKVGDTQLTAWAHAWGHWGSVASDGNAARMSDNGDGLLIGADLPVGTGRVGLTGGASRDSLSIGSRASWGRLTSQWLGAFGGVDVDRLALRGGIAYSWDQVPSNREVAFLGYTDRLSSNATGDTLTGFVEGAWMFHLAQGDISPFLNVAHTRVETDATAEVGGNAALRIDAGSANATTGTLGARGTWQIANQLDLHGELSWEHAFNQATPNHTVNFVAGGSSFVEYGVPVAKNAGLARIGLGWHVTSNVTFEANYEGLWGSGANDQAAKLSVNMAF